MKEVVYVAGPISGENKAIETLSCIKAAAIAYHLRKLGYVVICPHEHNLIGADCLDYDGWIMHGLRLLSLCSICFVMDGWEESSGTKIEMKYCIENEIETKMVSLWKDQVLIQDFSYNTNFFDKFKDHKCYKP